MSKKVAIASDHAGFQMKSRLATYLKSAGYDVVDLGTHSEDRVDYPDFAFALAEAIRKGDAPVGIAACGSGIGVDIALNRFAHIRSALCHDATTARLARQHNDANVLSLGARIIGESVALECVNAFLSTPFEGGRHADRVKKLGSCGA